MQILRYQGNILFCVLFFIYHLLLALVCINYFLSFWFLIIQLVSFLVFCFDTIVLFIIFNINKRWLVVVIKLSLHAHYGSLSLSQPLLFLPFFLGLLISSLVLQAVHFHLTRDVSGIYLLGSKIGISLLNILYMNFVGQSDVKGCSLKKFSFRPQLIWAPNAFIFDFDTFGHISTR